MALSVALLLLLVLAVFLFRSTQWVELTDSVIAHTYAAEKLSVDMETGLRAFQMTGDRQFLQPFDEAKSFVVPALEGLKLLAGKNSKQALAVQMRFEAWNRFSQDTLDRVDRGEDVRGVEWNLRGKALFDAFREASGQFIAGEEALRRDRLRTVDTLRGALIVTLILVALAGGPLLVGTFRRAVRRVNDAYRDGLDAVAAHRDELQVTLQSIGDAVLTTDGLGRIAFLNGVAERLTGWTTAEALGRAFSEILPIFNQETGEPVENPVVRVLAERVVVGLANHTVLRPRRGGEIVIEDSAAPIFNPDGSIRGVVLVFHDVTERNAKDRALREAEWLARTALNVANAGAWVWEIDRDLVFGDSLVAETFGLPIERCRAGEPIATLFAAICKEDRERVRATVNESLETGMAYQCEYRVLGAGDTERWVDSRGKVERDSRGRMTRLPGVLFDITARRRAEAELRASEELARAVVDTALDGVLLMDSSGRITDWNPAAERLFGWQKAEVVGHELAARVIPERLRASHRSALARFTSTGAAQVLGRRLELPAVRRDGTEFMVELSVNALGGVQQPLFVGFVRDISLRKIAEAELAERARLSSLRADVASLLGSRSDLDACLRECCELLVRHLGAAFARIWTVDESEPVLVLRASAGLYTHLNGAHARVPIGQYKIGRIAENRRAHLSNDVANDPNISDPAWAQRERMVAFAGYPLIAEGQVLGVLALFSRQILSEAVLGDLAPIADAIAASIEHRAAETALIAQKEKAEIASRAKDNFLAALSHELRTPLTPVLMTAAALRNDERLPDDIRADLGMMERNIALEARLIDDLLDLTRIAKGKVQLREELCDAHSLIGLALEIVRDEAESKSVSLQIELSARRTGLQGDPARLQQVFWNLLRNAIKFTPKGGHVTIRTRDEIDERLRFEVTDTGIGLPADALEAIFQPFEQAGRQNDHRFGGLGLGLAIARAIVDLHGGAIRAESAGLGHGATFIVELPRAGEQATGATLSFAVADHEFDASIDATKSPPAIRSLRLLIVEDHEPTLTVLRRLLLRDGHQVTTAMSVATARAAAEAAQFDIVISDLGLPDGTGIDVISNLLAVQPQVHAIALSGYGMEDDLRRSLDAGFATHLVKPVDLAQLRRALRDLGR